MPDLNSFASAAQSTVSVANASTLIAAANLARRFIRITNISNEACNIGLGVAAEANKGIHLSALVDTAKPAASGILEFPTPGGVMFTGAIYGITASGTKNVAVAEG